VVFSVPVDSSVEASQVVTIDASRCNITQSQLDNLKPVWNADGSISLPWNNGDHGFNIIIKQVKIFMTQVWIYSLVSVLIVSLVSLSGIVVLGLNHKRLKSILFYLVSFSAGALLGDVFIHVVKSARVLLNQLQVTF
jgi:hypothetical protein